MSDSSQSSQEQDQSLQALQAILAYTGDRPGESDAQPSEPMSELVEMLVEEIDSSRDRNRSDSTPLPEEPRQTATDSEIDRAAIASTQTDRSTTSPSPVTPRRRRLQGLLWELQKQEREGSQRNLTPQNHTHTPKKTQKISQTQTKTNSAASQPPLPAKQQPTSVEWQQLQQSVEQLRQQIQHLKQQVYEPTDLVNPLLPLIAELMESKVKESKQDVYAAMVPVIDRAIAERGRQDRIAMSKALSSIIPSAISEHIHEDPEDLAKALAPTMGAAIREQISIERDAMVDALYPVIGNTVSKYMTELVKSINDKIEKALSVEGVTRKVRAHMQGVSEAELIVRESMKFTIRAVFLIHKESGLAIAQAQPADMEQLESDMIAGMLTAIRSFANDTLSVGETTSELHEIEYDTFTIEIEAAGYCYLAVVTQGETTTQFIAKMRRTLSKIVERYHKPIKDFDGDPETVPAEIPALLENLSHAHQEEHSHSPRRYPPALLVILLLLLGGLGFWGWRHWQQQYLIGKIEKAWEGTPTLTIYQLQAKVKGSEIVLSGKLPTASLRQEAAAVAVAAANNRTVDNQIVAAAVPPYPEQVTAEIRRLTQVFNQQAGIDIATTYTNGKLTVSGRAQNPTQARRITMAMEQIPGLSQLVVGLQFGEVPLTTRVYFPPGSNQLLPRTLPEMLLPVAQFLQEHPQLQLTIVGHTDPSGDRATNQQLSRQRAAAVQKALQSQGIDGRRLQIRGIPQPPPQWNSQQPSRLARVVRFQTQFSSSQTLK
jgi:outer membrane protein OmpA-like peptidoglycan-associated protein